MHTCYKIYGYFEFHIFTYHLSPVVHSATLIYAYDAGILQSREYVQKLIMFAADIKQI